MAPKVSVIVPVYNTYNYLRGCLDSLISQTIDEIEVIVVNDGSPDNSQDIIDEYIASHPSKVKGFVKENGGLSDARNYGIERANGEYIGFVDSDDTVEPDFYERMYNKAIETSSDVVSSPVNYVYEDRVEKRFYNKRRFGVNVREDSYILLRANSYAWNKIYRTSFWKENDFRFPTQWYEDSALIYNVMLMANRVACVNIPFYNYVRDREDSIVNSVNDKLYDVFKSTDSIISFYKEHGAFDELYEMVELLCLRHIFGRIDILHNTEPSDFNRKFVEYAIEYLNSNFRDWRSSSFLQPTEKSGRLRKIELFYKRHDSTLKKYASGKTLMLDYATAYSLEKEAKKKNRQLRSKRYQEKKESSDTKKRAAIQRYGLWAIHDVQSILQKNGIVSFADFGTCLGIVREGNILKHDMDIDIGVIADYRKRQTIHVAMERAGYKLWRRYIYGNIIAEESYKIRGIRVDLGYYTVDSEKAQTSLFYRKPDVEYKGNIRHIVEMTYSPIKGVKEVVIEGVPVKIPENAEKLMEEKYGSGWRTPDKGWIYWESPAAKKLDEIGHYITYIYQSIKNRSREVPIPLLVDSTPDGSANWQKAYSCADEGHYPILIGTKEDQEKNRHPRIKVYAGDNDDDAFIERIRKKECGAANLVKYQG